jgi:hypothetical protein
MLTAVEAPQCTVSDTKTFPCNAGDWGARLLESLAPSSTKLGLHGDTIAIATGGVGGRSGPSYWTVKPKIASLSSMHRRGVA